jgi:arylsulfatase A-like enzyme
LHGNSLYRQLVHVPLIVLFPPQVPPTVVDEFVTLRDLPATVLDLTVGSSDALPGSSWSRCWASPSSPPISGSPLFQVVFFREKEQGPDRGRSPVARGNIVSLFEKGKYYIKNLTTGEEEIYDFLNDPSEQVNLVLRRENEPLLLEFRRSLGHFLATHKSRWVDFP